MSKGSLYSQTRRDTEKSARLELEELIPKQYLEDVNEEAGNTTYSGKAMRAVMAYMRDLFNNVDTANTRSDRTTSNPQARPQTKTTGQQRPGAFSQPSQQRTPPKLRTSQEYQAMKQVMERVLQIFRGQVTEDGEVPAEAKVLMDEVNDMLVDIVHRIEGDRGPDA